MKYWLKHISLATLLTIMLSSCNNFFGKKTNLDFLPPPNYSNKPVAYVPLQPDIKGLQRPTDVIVGWDQLIYVADAGAQKIYSYDISGTPMSSFYIPGLTSVAQDRHLNLLAIGTIDTVINFKKYNLAAIYRIKLDNPQGYGLQNAVIINKTVHPFYFTTGFKDLDSQTRFNHIAILADNSYYATRTGPSNSQTQFGGPDDAVLQFSASDVFETPIYVTTTSGQYTNYFKMPFGIASRAQPPQSTSVNTKGDFIFTSVEPGFPIDVQEIDKTVNAMFGVFYSLAYYPIGDTTKASGFLYTPNKFVQPTGVTIAGDGTNYVWVVDAYKDSLYQFNGQGLEGVTPPPGYGSTKNIKVSFGGQGNDLSHFDQPMAVAYYNKIVYVADAGNGRILRFELTTDLNLK